MTEFIDDNSKMFSISVGGILPEEIRLGGYSGTDDDEMLNISAGAIPTEPMSEPLPPYSVVGDPTLQLPMDEITPWDQEIKASAITGSFDSWLGEVTAVHYAAADPLLNCVQSVEVRRVAPTWLGNNTPAGYEISQAQSQPTVARAVALPWPPRHDQQLYHVAVGDLVAVISGRDGRHYYFNDELPFVGRVIKVGNATEDNTGGAGLTVLSVRRQSLAADPDGGGFAGATLTNTLAVAGTTIDYAGVLVIRPTNQSHGYRTGDYVWVQRRGRYYFASPAKETFIAYLVNAGPSEESDFTTNHYWARELDHTVTYVTNAWTSTVADRTQTDPSGSGGRYGRWVDAANLEEPATSHALPVVAPANPTTGTQVIVSVFADPANGKPYYCFSRTSAFIRFGKPTGAYSSGATMTLDPCDIAGVDNGLANVTVQAGYTMPYSTTIPTTAIVPFMQAADGLWYVVGVPKTVMTAIEYTGASEPANTLHVKYKYDFGLFTGTESDWQTVFTATAFACP